MIISSSGGCSLENVSSIPLLGDNPVHYGGSVHGPVTNSNHLPMGVVVLHSASSGPSSASAPSSSCLSLSSNPSTVEGLILPDVSNVQQACSSLPREASTSPSVVVSGGTIMAPLPSSDHSHLVIFQQRLSSRSPHFPFCRS
ncbi:hypothetical protein LWI29_025000 [Acer saccharum]|uniref:Uncharacterized protein n=1 Tax=Acer saccharum TaxID=4024 RepID=A0AA39VW40_ACESA|nr:hypothetical protein LWI29_025000 [Acer saccharum]